MTQEIEEKYNLKKNREEKYKLCDRFFEDFEGVIHFQLVQKEHSASSDLYLDRLQRMHEISARGNDTHFPLHKAKTCCNE